MLEGYEKTWNFFYGILGQPSYVTAVHSSQYEYMFTCIWCIKENFNLYTSVS